MVSYDKAGQLVSANVEAHHRLCLEVSALQTELTSLKNGTWKKFQRPDPEEKKSMVVGVRASAEPSTKMRLCACGCGEKRRCSGNEQQPLPPLVGAGQGLTKIPCADPAAQREYHEKLAQPRKNKEAGEDVSVRRNSKQVVDVAHLEQLAVPREKAREQSIKRKEGPVPKLPDLRSLQAKVLAADERLVRGTSQKSQKPPPFISCPAKPAKSSSAPQLHMGHKPGNVPQSAVLPVMPRQRRRLPALKARDMDDLPGLRELREHHCMDPQRVAMAWVPSSKSGCDSPGPEKRAPKKLVRSMDAQQLYIDRYLAAPPKPKSKQEILKMKLEELRNERLAREGGESKSNVSQVLQEPSEPVLWAVNWGELV